MASAPVESLGTPPWSREDLREALDAFVELYARRPISENAGGMRAPHMFATWFALTRLAPEAIVESGLWRGQSTWLLQQACPDATLHCIDVDLSRLEYHAEGATYHDRDFSEGDWSDLPRDRTVLFFDDHQDAVARVRLAEKLGFKHLLFEDNYPATRGDCYSLKKAFAGAGYAPETHGLSKLKSALGVHPPGHVPAGDADARYLRGVLDVYFEFPPPHRPPTTRWGDAWDDAVYPTPEALLADGEGAQVFRDEARDYTWLCYARLR